LHWILQDRRGEIRFRGLSSGSASLQADTAKLILVQSGTVLLKLTVIANNTRSPLDRDLAGIDSDDIVTIS